MSLDKITYMLNKIKNTAMVGKDVVEVSHTNRCEDIATVLKDAGFLSEIKVYKESGSKFKSMRLNIAKDSFGLKVTDIKRVSRPGRRIYRGVDEIKTHTGNSIVTVVSTSRGIMSGSEAKKRKLGGEVICIVR